MPSRHLVGPAQTYLLACARNSRNFCEPRNATTQTVQRVAVRTLAASPAPRASGTLPLPFLGTLFLL